MFKDWGGNEIDVFKKNRNNVVRLEVEREE